jgi:hypothetical protein
MALVGMVPSRTDQPRRGIKGYSQLQPETQEIGDFVAYHLVPVVEVLLERVKTVEAVSVDGAVATPTPQAGNQGQGLMSTNFVENQVMTG